MSEGCSGPSAEIDEADLPDDLVLAIHIYDGLTEQEVAAIEEIILDRDRFARKRRDLP